MRRGCQRLLVRGAELSGTGASVSAGVPDGQCRRVPVVWLMTLTLREARDDSACGQEGEEVGRGLGDGASAADAV